MLVHCVLCSLLTRLSTVATLGVDASESIYDMGRCLDLNKNINNTDGMAHYPPHALTLSV